MQSERPGSLLLLVGDEPFFKAEAIAALEKDLDRPPKVEIAVGKSGAQKVLDEIRKGSLFNPRRIVLAREAEALTTDHWEALLAHQASRSPTVLVLDVESLDKRYKGPKALLAKASVVECKALYESTPPWVKDAKPWETPLAEWTAKRAVGMGVRLGSEAAYYLTRITGNNLYEIVGTLEKLRLSGVEEITLREVEALAGKNRRDDVFAVADAVGRRELGRALASTVRIFDRGLPGKDGSVIGDPGTIGIIVLGRIFARLKEIGKLRQHLAQGGGRTDLAVAKACGVAPFLAGRALADAGAWEGKDLGRALDLVEEAQCALKGLEERGRPKLVLERLIVAFQTQT